jgi:hypothetical protein
MSQGQVITMALFPYKGSHTPLHLKTAEQRSIFEIVREAFDEVEDTGGRVVEVYMTKEIFQRIKQYIPMYFFHVDLYTIFDRQHKPLKNEIGTLMGAKAFLMTNDNEQIRRLNLLKIKCVSKNSREIDKFDVIIN